MNLVFAVKIEVICKKKSLTTSNDVGNREYDPVPILDFYVNLTLANIEGIVKVMNIVNLSYRLIKE